MFLNGRRDLRLEPCPDKKHHEPRRTAQDLMCRWEHRGRGDHIGADVDLVYGSSRPDPARCTPQSLQPGGIKWAICWRAGEHGSSARAFCAYKSPPRLTGGPNVGAAHQCVCRDQSGRAVTQIQSPAGRPQGARTGLLGTWRWRAQCPTGKYRGTYDGHWTITDHDARGNISGSFGNGHPGPFQGRVSGSSLQFVRSFGRGNAVRQTWTGTITREAPGARSQFTVRGSLTDPEGGCSFTAEKP